MDGSGLRAGRWLVVAAALGPLACRTPAPPPPVARPAPPPPPGLHIQKTREELHVAPWELAFSGVRGEDAVSETVVVRNMVDHPVEVRAIKVVGDAAAQFALAELPALPATVMARGSLSIQVVFKPAVETPPGVQRATLRIQVGAELDEGPATDLTALVLAGREPDQEPCLQEIIEALGFAFDVGGRTLTLPVGEEPIGAGVPLSLFARARSGPVAVDPVARFSADEELPFGYFVLKQQGRGRPGKDQPDARPLGTLVAGSHHTLNPELAPDGQTNFDPGEAEFGLWIKTRKQTVYSDVRHNRGKARRGIRLYPLRARNGAAIANAYLLAFADPLRGDFQDAVFVLWNVRPAGAAPPAATAEP